jgi:hypothetical protein
VEQYLKPDKHNHVRLAFLRFVGLFTRFEKLSQFEYKSLKAKTLQSCTTAELALRTVQEFCDALDGFWLPPLTTLDGIPCDT